MSVDSEYEVSLSGLQRTDKKIPIAQKATFFNNATMLQLWQILQRDLAAVPIDCPNNSFSGRLSLRTFKQNDMQLVYNSSATGLYGAVLCTFSKVALPYLMLIVNNVLIIQDDIFTSH